MADKGTFAKNLERLKSVNGLESIDLYHDGESVATIPNQEGKRGSLQVYANVMDFQNGILDSVRAGQALSIFGEYTEEAKQNPGQHPNIDMLFDIQSGYEVCVMINKR